MTTNNNNESSTTKANGKGYKKIDDSKDNLFLSMAAKQLKADMRELNKLEVDKSPLRYALTLQNIIDLAGMSLETLNKYKKAR